MCLGCDFPLQADSSVVGYVPFEPYTKKAKRYIIGEAFPLATASPGIMCPAGIMV